MTSSRKLKITPSSGNVFRDLGFREEAEHLLVRADLMIQVQKLIESRGLKQRTAIKILGVPQPRVSDLLRGRSICSVRMRSSTCWPGLARRCASP
jgi:predicted XRE-type DNA-binding protein